MTAARIACIPDPKRRVSPDSAWPIRRADGKTYAEVRPTYQRKEWKNG